MLMQPLFLRAFAFLAGVVILGLAGLASADPPSRVARLGYVAGVVSFSPAGEDDWVQAGINRPLTTGDRLWADRGARAEIQVAGAMIRMNAETSVSVLNLDDRIAQLQLTQGALNVRVRRLEPGQVVEVDTPNLAFTLRQPGEYRIEVDPDGNATTIVVRKGQGEVYGEDASYVIDSRQPYRFMGTGLRDYEYVDAPRPDEFDRWASDRDRRYDSSVSARYVSPDVVGYQDLDANGTWRVDATYGNVWYPSRVAAGWAPYRNGHWAWVDPWGWTWVDDAPWGFAVSHYGRWSNFHGTWGWVPGPVRTRAYYAPALVVFVGGANFQLAISSGNVGGVAWFPLGPREVYRPSYPVSRGYYENINRSNTVISNTVINNTYNNTNITNVVYANRRVQGAVVAVPTSAFVQSQPVSRVAVRVSQEVIVGAPMAVVPPVAPTEKSVRGAAAQRDKPPSRVFERHVVARTAPPAAPVGFATQQRQLTAKPGKPLDAAARKELKRPAAAPAPAVKLVAQPQEARPTKRPPPAASRAGPGDTRGKSDERNAPAAPTISGATGAPTQVGVPSQATPPPPRAQLPSERGKSEPREKGKQREQPVSPPPAPPQGQAATPPPPTAQPPRDRGKSEPREKGKQREQPVSPPPAPPQAEAATPPPPTAQPPRDRGKSEPRGRGKQREQPVAPPPAPPQAEAAKPPQVALPAPATGQPARPAKPEPASDSKPGNPSPPVAASRLPQSQPASEAESRDQESKADAGKAEDWKRDRDERERDEEYRRQMKPQ